MAIKMEREYAHRVLTLADTDAELPGLAWQANTEMQRFLRGVNPRLTFTNYRVRLALSLAGTEKLS